MGQLKPARKIDGKYQNPVPTSVGGFRTMWKVLPLYFSNREESEPKEPLGPFHTDPQAFATPPASGLRITWFGHSAMLIEIDGLRVLVDPVWEERASPVQFAGPKRFFPPTLALEDLPDLDAVLVSHDHYDHFGAATLKQLSRMPSTARAQWVTSAGVGRRLERLGIDPQRIAALDWTETAEVAGREPGSMLRFTAWPARHFSGRSLHDRFSTLWSCFVLESARHRVFFGADSGFWEGFADIAAHYTDHPAGRVGPDGQPLAFDVTMLEIGAFHPLWSDIHMGPEGAVQAYESMGGRHRAGALFPIHWGLFNLALHGWRQPIERVLELARERNVELWVPEPGVPTEVACNGRGACSEWWQAAHLQTVTA